MSQFDKLYTSREKLVKTVMDLTENVNRISGEVNTKQDTLVSGESIKTVNGESLLGSGGLAISGETLVVDETPTSGSDNLVKSGGVKEELVLGSVYDVSAHNDGTTFASLSALLSSSSLSTLIPTAVRKGGMSIKFVLTSDNNYVQYLYKVTDAETVATFTNVANWEKMNLEKEVNQLIFNINKYNNHPAAYSSIVSARNAVPTNVRATGVILVSYIEGYGRYIEQYIGEGAYSNYPSHSLFQKIVTGDDVDFLKSKVNEIKELYITGISESDLPLYKGTIYRGEYNFWGVVITRISDNVNVASCITNGNMPTEGVYYMEEKNNSGISGYVYLSYKDSGSTEGMLFYKQVLFLGNSPLIIDYLSGIRTDALFNEAKDYTDTTTQQINNKIDKVFTEYEENIQFPIASNRIKKTTNTYGWGLAICENKTISAVSAIICAKSTAITKVRIQLLKGTRSGDVIADKTVDVNIAANSEQKVTVTYDEPVSYSGVIYCVVRYNALGDWYRWNDYSTYPYPNIAPSYLPTAWDATPADSAAGFYIAVEYVEVTTGLSENEVERIVEIVKEETDISSLEQEVEDVKESSDLDMAISLPEKLVAVVGDTIQLFYKGMIGAVNPYGYDILVTCSKGKPYPRYWEFTPSASDVGTYIFNVKVKSNNGAVLAEKSTSLVVAAAPSNPLSQLNVVCIGDSNTTDGAWPAEALRRLTGSGGNPAGKGLANISFCGLMTKKGAGYCGFGGWSWGSYISHGKTAIRFTISGVSVEPEYGSVYSNNGKNFTVQEVNITSGAGTILCTITNSSDRPTASGTLTKISGNGDSEISFSAYTEDSVNPFWDTTNNKFSFVPYANLYCNGTIDVVYTLLSWNGLDAWKDNWSSVLSSMATFASTLHTEFPNAKLRILGMQVPPVLGSMGYADSYGMIQTILSMNKAYQEFANDNSEFVEFVNVSTQFDTDNCCRTDVKMLRNKRAFLPYDSSNIYYMGDTVDKTVYDSQQGIYVHTPWVCIAASTTGEWDASKWQVAPERIYEPYCVNAVHPGYNGYCQIADVVYRDFVAEFCQST